MLPAYLWEVAVDWAWRAPCHARVHFSFTCARTRSSLVTSRGVMKAIGTAHALRLSSASSRCRSSTTASASR
eukprot:5342823-Prymnesium_polylepis.1